MIKYSKLLENTTEKRFRDILKKMHLIDNNKQVNLINMNKKLNDFLSIDNNKSKFIKDLNQNEIKSEIVNIRVNELRPTQNIVYLEKIIEKILSNNKFAKKCIKGRFKNHEILIGSDNHIIDGHHRSYAIFIINPKCDIQCTKINLTAETAIPIFNTILKFVDVAKDSNTNYKYNIFDVVDSDNIKMILNDVIHQISNKIWQTKSIKKISKFFSKLYKIDDNREDPLNYLINNINKIQKPTNNKLLNGDDIDEVIDVVLK
jgi:hypothetical protein